MSLSRTQMRYMNPYDLHKALINEYVLTRPGDTQNLKRNTAKDRTDFDVLRDNHQFLWDDSSSSSPLSWEKELAKKYYEKLFKEYCLADLTLYKENKIALRWRLEHEVVQGKGQFSCGNKKCSETADLTTWEVNFAYKENNEKKNALVKIRLCVECSVKLNFHKKRKEVKRLKKHKRKQKDKREKVQEVETLDSSDDAVSVQEQKEDPVESPWEQEHKQTDAKTRDEEMEDYLQDLLL